MEITVWIAVAVGVLASTGPQYAVRSEAFPTYEACVAFQAAAMPEIAGMIGPDLIAQGAGCAEVKVRAVEAPKPSREFTPEEKKGGKVNGKSFL